MFLLTLLLLNLFVQAEDDPFACYEDLKIIKVNVILRTSNEGASSSKGENPAACLETKDGYSNCVTLPNLDGHDMEYVKASWWELNDFNGLNLCDLTKFRLKAQSGDGFGFVTCSVVVEANDGKAYVAVHFNGSTKWLDTDESDQKEQAFDIEPTFGYPKGENALATVKRIHIFAESGDDSDATFHFHIVSDNVPYSAELIDNFGNDMESHRTDYWHIGDGWYFIPLLEIGKISKISFAQEGSNDDGWTINKAMVYFQTDKGYYVSNLDRTKREIDGDAGEEKKEATLDFIYKWNEEVFSPEDYTRGGHWKYIAAVDPVVTPTIDMQAEFKSEDGVINEEDEMNGYSDTYSHGGSFQFCEKSGISEGGFSAEESACAEYDWNHDHSTSWEQTTMHSVEHRTSQSITYEWKEEIHCDQVETCYIWQWVSMVANEKTKSVRELATLDVEIIMDVDKKPLCMPGQCVQATDCQTCHNSPDPDLVDPGTAVGSTSETTFEYMGSYFVYGGFLLMAFVAGNLLQKYNAGKLLPEKQYIDMAKLDVTYST